MSPTEDGKRGSEGSGAWLQVHPHDAFGSTMVKNISARGCPLQVILKPTNVCRNTGLVSE
eukprot:3914755-Rhodomonas_salina.3